MNIPCGGCGETDEQKRCLGCLHDFKGLPPAWLCSLCGDPTNVVVNIAFRKTPLCDPCCLTITKQTVHSLNLESLRVAGGQQ